MGDLRNFPLVQRTKCDQILQTSGRSEDYNICPTSFDGMICWPATPALENASMPCPPTIITYLANITILEVVLADVFRVLEFEIQNATRNCSFVEGINEVEWDPANYSLCPKNELNAFNTFKSAFHSWWKDEYSSSQTIYSTAFFICYRIGYGISFIALGIALAIFRQFKRLKNSRNILHANFFVSLMLRAVAMVTFNYIFQPYMRVNLVTVDISYDDDGYAVFTETNLWVFKFLQLVINYFYFSTHSWLLMEGWYLHTLIHCAPCTLRISHKRYIYFGWGLPVVATVIWLIVHIYIPTNEMWFENEYTKYTVIGPVILVILVNLVFIINIVRVLGPAIKKRSAMRKKRVIQKRWAKSLFLLLPLFGQYEVFSVVRYFSHDRTIADLAYVVSHGLSAIQGLFVSIAYCFLNFEVRKELQQYWKNRKYLRRMKSDLSNRRILPRRGLSRSVHRPVDV